MTDSETRANPQQKFDALFDVYKRLYDRFTDFGLRNGAFSALVLGWAISSENTQDFIQARGWGMKISLGLGMLIYTIFHGHICRSYYLRSQRCLSHIQELNFVNADLLSGYQVTNHHWRLVAVFHSILSGYIVFLTARM